MTIKSHLNFREVNFHVLISLTLSSLIFTGSFLVLLHEYRLLNVARPSFSIDFLINILSGIDLPLPTVPILIVLSLTMFISMPEPFYEKRKREMRIRLLCGAQKKEVFGLTFLCYAAHAAVGLFCGIIMIFVLKFVSFAAFSAAVSAFAFELLISAAIFMAKKY